ncbi:MAG: pyridoxal phosphate-dependent aminotransferase [Clostridiales Family XIII bacterium]|jgi:alanine-synthesizing transaminase|nr:pyridoxal phosphate-dependent aminotransferase [Clostridiales Family XIII bacterium]
MREIRKTTKLDNVGYDIRGPVADEATRMTDEGIDIISLNTGNPAPFGLYAPEFIEDAISTDIKNTEGYSDSRGLYSARKAIADYAKFKGIDGVGTSDVYTGNGVSEMISIALQALLNDGDEILLPTPDYPLWTSVATLCGGRAVHYICDEEAGWLPDIDDIKRKVTGKTRAIVVINPNNPTGALYPKEVLEQIVKIAEQNDLVLFSDEVYDRLVFNGEEHISTASLSGDVFTVTLNGLSKSHMIAGFRCGWMSFSGNRKVAKNYIEGINMLASMRLCANVPAQSVIARALSDPYSAKHLLQPGGRIYEQMDLIHAIVNDIPGLSAVRPKAGFYIFPKIDTKRFNITDDEQFVLDFLREKHVLMTHGGGFNWPKPDHFRIVYLPEVGELTRIADKMRSFLSTYKQEV